jgi:hypothetical protein
VAVANPERQDTWLVTAVLEGKDLGIFDKKEGGEVDSDENKYPLGGMLGEISLGGRNESQDAAMLELVWTCYAVVP